MSEGTPIMQTATPNETPKYRVTFETRPSPNSRHRFERPFSYQSDATVWQYQEPEQTLRAGTIVETKLWPHANWFPLNEAARTILSFFNSRQKSRLPLTPFDTKGKLRLDEGLQGAIPKIGVPHLEPVGQDPRQVWPGL